MSGQIMLPAVTTDFKNFILTVTEFSTAYLASDKHNLTTAKAMGLAMHHFSMTGAFWQTPVYTVYTYYHIIDLPLCTITIVPDGDT